MSRPSPSVSVTKPVAVVEKDEFEAVKDNVETIVVEPRTHDSGCEGDWGYTLSVIHSLLSNYEPCLYKR